MTAKLHRINASVTAQRALAVKYAQQVIPIDDNWRIVRADRYNWEIQYKGKFHGYYSHLVNALQALPRKMLDETAQTSLTALLEPVNNINARIEQALKLKLA